jgi:hypothetical protein
MQSMKSKVLILAATLAAALGCVAQAQATSMVSMSMVQLTQASSDIVQARVVSQVSQWNATHTRIETITTLDVSQALKGNAGSTIEVHQNGGTVGPVTQSVMGDVYLRAQGEYVLFLEPDSPSAFHVVGLSQGAYPIYGDAGSQNERVVLPLNQSAVQAQVTGGGNPAGTVPLAGFHKYVSVIVGAGVQIPHGVSLPVAIAYAESRGVGRAHVYAKTTAQIFPNPTSVIPTGTEVEGEAILSGELWTIRWDEVNIRGVHAAISATSIQPAGGLRGRNVILSVR